MAAAVIAIAGCTEEQQGGLDANDDKISLTPSTLTFQKDGGEEPVMVTSSGEWTLKADQTYDWITADIDKGKDGDVVKFTAKPNYTGEELSASFVFTCGNATAKLTALSQSGDSRFLNLVSASESEVSYDTDRFEVVLGTNIHKDNFKTSVDSEFCTFKLAKEGDKSVTMVFDIKRNEARDNRTAEITIKADESKEPGTEGLAPVKVKLTQRAQPVIATDKQEYVIASEGGRLEMSVDANVEYSVTVDGEWLKYEGNSTGKEVFSAGALTATANEATVTFTEKSPLEGAEPFAVSVKVNQKSVAGLISKVVRMTGSRAWPNWSASVFQKLAMMPNFSFEILFKADDFGPFGNVSTLFGIHEHFLFHFGDSDLDAHKLRISSRWNQKTDNEKLTFEAGKWYHLAFTFNRGYIKFYVDGKVVYEENRVDYLGLAVDFNIPHNQTEATGKRCFWVGYSYEANRDFDGLFSEMRFWNKTLSDAEIHQENHFYTVDPKSEGLLGYWKFAESSVVEGKYVIADETGNNSPLMFEKYKNGSWIDNEEPVFETVSLP